VRVVAAALIAGVLAASCSSDVVIKLETNAVSTTASADAERSDAALNSETSTSSSNESPAGEASQADELDTAEDELMTAGTTPETVEFPEEFEGQVRPVAVIGDALPFLNDSHNDEAVGTQIPAIIGENFEGNTVEVRPGAGVPTLVVFLAHWCPHCNNEIPEINRIRDAGVWPDGLRVIGVSTAVSPQRPNFPPQRWLIEKDWTYEIIADAFDSSRSTFVAAEAFGVTGFPFMVLIDESGLVRGRWSGELGALALAELVTSLINPPADV